MKSFAIIEGDRVSVAPFTERHLTNRYVSWLNDPEVVRFSEQRHRSHSLESCQDYFRSVKNSGDLFLAVESPDFGHIGNIGVTVDPWNGVGDIAILIGEKQAWGRGLASTAWKMVMDTLFREHDFRKLTAGTMSENHAMLQLMSRCGMKVEARLARQFVWEGKEIDLVRAAAFASC